MFPSNPQFILANVAILCRRWIVGWEFELFVWIELYKSDLTICCCCCHNLSSTTVSLQRQQTKSTETGRHTHMLLTWTQRTQAYETPPPCFQYLNISRYILSSIFKVNCFNSVPRARLSSLIKCFLKKTHWNCLHFSNVPKPLSEPSLTSPSDRPERTRTDTRNLLPTHSGSSSPGSQCREVLKLRPVAVRGGM